MFPHLCKQLQENNLQVEEQTEKAMLSSKISSFIRKWGDTAEVIH